MTTKEAKPSITIITHGGRIVIPARYRAALGIREGDRLVIRLEDDGLRINSVEGAVRRAQDIVRSYIPDDVSLADELIADRRREQPHDR